MPLSIVLGWYHVQDLASQLPLLARGRGRGIFASVVRTLWMARQCHQICQRKVEKAAINARSMVNSRLALCPDHSQYEAGESCHICAQKYAIYCTVGKEHGSPFLAACAVRTRKESYLGRLIPAFESHQGTCLRCRPTSRNSDANYYFRKPPGRSQQLS